LEKGGEGGFEKANKERRDMELLIVYKISPDPSLLKRATELASDIFIIPLGKRRFYLPPVGKEAHVFPPFSTLLFVTEPFGFDRGILI
jgi:hypothetical protein